MFAWTSIHPHNLFLRQAV